MLGVDSSPEMLLVASSSSSSSSAAAGGRGRKPPPPPPLSGQAVLADLGHPSPFASRELWRRRKEEEDEREEGASAGGQRLDRRRQRRPLSLSSSSSPFDAAVSVSAIQWLCHDPRNPQRAMRAFFEGLAAVLAPGAGAILQSYPRMPLRPPPPCQRSYR